MMRTEAKLTSKGQITVPKQVRDALGVKAGDKLIFEQNGSDISVRRASIRAAIEKYRGIGTPGIGSGRRAVIKAIRDMRDGK
jgi:AbrB family looped-hinge helix DNA binding protein